MNGKSILKKFYDLLPFKKQVFQIIKLFNPEHELYKHLYFVDWIRVEIESSKSFLIRHYGFQVENELFWKGVLGHEGVSMKQWIELSRNAKVVFDIGANTGIYGLVTQTLNPSAKIFAFEPVARVFQKLRLNIEKNNFPIYPVEKAASNFNGSASIYDLPSEHIYSVTVGKDLSGSKDSKKVEISTLRLDTFIKENNITNIDLMKIDVETHEPEVLEGMGVFLRQFMPTLLIEILNEEVAEKVNTVLDGMNYLFFNIDELAGIRQTAKIEKSDYYNYLVCSPEVAKNLKLI